MVRSYEETQKMLKKSAELLVSCYVGQNLYDIGTHMKEKSSYNHNFYKLPNGTTVLLENDDDGFNQVAVEWANGELTWIGAQYDDEGLMIGEYY